jgi:hypothetical protein
MAIKRSLLPTFLILTAVALTFLRVPLASSQGLTLVAAAVSGDLPMEELDSEVWQQTTAVEIPLSAQNIARPMGGANVRAVTARALHDGARLAVLVEWVDDTLNDQAIRVQDFADAVALQFPQSQGQPFFCMGMQGGSVNIWHWKADRQADVLAWQDMEAPYPDMNVDQYPFAEGPLPSPAGYVDPNYLTALAAGNLAAAPRLSPVEDLVAGGFGSLTSEAADAQNVQGYGAWAEGKWRVIFHRDLLSTESGDVNFTPGQVYSIAFAAWDGANGERNGQKSTSQWVSFQLEGTAKASPAVPQSATAQAAPIPKEMITAILVGVQLALIAAGIFIYLRLPDK